MNKQEAADYLGVSTKTIERYVQKGELPAKYVQGKTRKTVIFEKEDLDSLKEKIEGTIHSPQVISENQELAVYSNSQNNQLSELAQAIESLHFSSVSDLPIMFKPLLTLKEAQIVTGLSKEILRDAIKDKKLKAKIIGKGWRIKRTDLDKFIEEL
jgi:excisionase family DNA binding protein